MNSLNQGYDNVKLLTGCIKVQRIFLVVEEQCIGLLFVKILVVVERLFDHNFSKMHPLFLKLNS